MLYQQQPLHYAIAAMLWQHHLCHGSSIYAMAATPAMAVMTSYTNIIIIEKMTFL